MSKIPMVQLYNQNIFFVQKDARGYSIYGLFLTDPE
jgi:hypothetical protein